MNSLAVSTTLHMPPKDSIKADKSISLEYWIRDAVCSIWWGEGCIELVGEKMEAFVNYHKLPDIFSVSKLFYYSRHGSTSELY
jgi:hypothetical protein